MREEIGSRLRNAVVTGSTTGIGLAYARALAQEGANVCINGFGRPEEIERQRAAIEGEFKVDGGIEASARPPGQTSYGARGTGRRFVPPRRASKHWTARSVFTAAYAHCRRNLSQHARCAMPDAATSLDIRRYSVSTPLVDCNTRACD